MVSVPARRRCWLRLGLATATVAAAGACDAAAPVPEFDEAPTVGLLLTPELETFGPGLPVDSGLHAILVTTGTPLRSPYLRADRFEMRRMSDGASFAWRSISPPEEAVGVPGPFGGGNYFLPRAAGSEGLGSDSIAPGEVYELVVEAGAHRIIGRTRVPGRIEIVRAATDGDTVVRWRRVPGAAGYMIGSTSFGEVQPADDTVFVFPSYALPPDDFTIRVRVFALDSSYAAFQSDTRVSRAGITGAWGVFGSYTWADAVIPPAAANASRR